MPKWIKPAIGALVFIYPFCIYFGLQAFSVSYIAALGCGILILRYVLFKNLLIHKGLALISLAVAAFLLVSATTNSKTLLLLYPIFVNCGFIIVFAYSLFNGPSIVTIIASMRENLDEAGVLYTRKVTKAWIGFFLVNAAISACTVVIDNQDVWLAYNGVISYILIGLFFLAELLIRRKYKAKQTVE